MIAELKRASPSRGVIRASYDPPSIARGYAAAGATALSVLTDTHFFGGALDHLSTARAASGLRCLRKDFSSTRTRWRRHAPRAPTPCSSSSRRCEDGLGEGAARGGRPGRSRRPGRGARRGRARVGHRCRRQPDRRQQPGSGHVHGLARDDGASRAACPAGHAARRRERHPVCGRRAAHGPGRCARGAGRRGVHGGAPIRGRRSPSGSGDREGEDLRRVYGRRRTRGGHGGRRLPRDSTSIPRAHATSTSNARERSPTRCRGRRSWGSSSMRPANAWSRSLRRWASRRCSSTATRMSPYCREWPWRTIKALRARPGVDLIGLASGYPTDYLLLDSFAPGRAGGTGVALDPASATGLPAARLFVAGGLRPETVADVVRALRPYRGRRRLWRRGAPRKEGSWQDRRIHPPCQSCLTRAAISASTEDATSPRP